ncbi:hypothetical protein MY539_07430 [Haemophilus influenzae]
MTKSLDEIAKQLKDSDKNVNLIYAFNGTGKTRLSKVFKNLIAPKENHGNEEELARRKYFISMHLPRIYSIGIMILLMTQNPN